MERITKENGTIKGLEVLYFEEVEVQKVKGSLVSFASSGPLSVLYFKDFNRFVLRVNDWSYPLMRRIPISSESGAGENYSFKLPTLHGFSYRLFFNNIAENPAFTNFLTILENNTGLFVPGVSKKLESSPDDKLVRHPEAKEGHHVAGTISGLIKSGIDKVRHATQGLTGTKNLLSTKKRMMPSDIKNKNFKKLAKPTFKKNFFEGEVKSTQHFLELRRNNVNIKEVKEYKTLLKTSDVPSLYLFKSDVEEAILIQKDVIHARHWEVESEKTSIVNSIKTGLTGIKESVTGLIHREAPKDNTLTNPSLVEGINHYSG